MGNSIQLFLADKDTRNDAWETSDDKNDKLFIVDSTTDAFVNPEARCIKKWKCVKRCELF